MPRFDSRYVDGAYEPPSADVAAKKVAENVGTDTATALTRRDVLKAQAAALRAGATLPVALYDLLDGLIAATFDV